MQTGLYMLTLEYEKKSVLLPRVCLIMPPTLKKFRRHIALGLSVHLFIHMSRFLVSKISKESLGLGSRKFAGSFEPVCR